MTTRVLVRKRVMATYAMISWTLMEWGMGHDLRNQIKNKSGGGEKGENLDRLWDLLEPPEAPRPLGTGK